MRQPLAPKALHLMLQADIDLQQMMLQRLVQEFLASGATFSHLKNERGPISRAEVETKRELLRVAIQRLKAPVTVKRRENDLYLARKETLTG